MTLKDVKRKNVNWFSKANKRFFGDVDYWLYHGRDGQHYLVRLSKAFSDMFGNIPQYRYYINPVSDDGEIEHLLDVSFSTRKEAKEFIKNIK